MLTRYRIAVINDFRNSTAFVDFCDYGNLKIWNASKVSGPTTYAKSDDAVHVYLNFKLVCSVKEVALAESAIKKLLLNSPVDLYEYLDVLEL